MRNVIIIIYALIPIESPRTPSCEADRTDTRDNVLLILFI